jgi:hypothetical protein
MNKLNLVLLIVILVLTNCFNLIHTEAKQYFISASGSDSNTGTISSPYLTITKAAGVASAGDTIYMRGGTYTLTAKITLSQSGTSTAKRNLWSYPGERALLDFSGESFGTVGINLTGSYWYIKGISVYGAGDNGLHITSNAAYNTIEFCEFYENRDSGLQIDGGANNNSIINCDSYYNADPSDYGDADGFAVKMAVGTGNYFYGCRSWNNCDDGWDGYLRGADDVYTTIENCWTWSNGYFKDGTDAGSNANGNGFKMGGSDDKTLMHNFTLKNCLAFNNKAKGFDQNNNKGNMTLYNCTSYNNVGYNFSITSSLNTNKTCTIVNCASLGTNVKNLGSFVVQYTNSWLTGFTTTSADFQSVLSTGAAGARQADGSLPIITFMHLVSGSDLIDAGTDVGIAYNGTKPDLGAWETGNYNVVITTSGNGFVSLNPSGGVYTAGTSVTVTATPLLGYNFINFSGDLSGSSTQQTISVNSNIAITASFTTSTTKVANINNANTFISCTPTVTDGFTKLTFSLNESETVDLAIYNSKGTLVWMQKGINTQKGVSNIVNIDLSSFNAGVYICKILSKKSLATCKLIKL